MLEVLAAAVLSLAAPAHPTTHLRGCRSTRCDRHVRAMLRRRYPPRPMQLALASWYDDAGGTACGTHAGLGVAHRSLPCGTRVRLCYVGCETATVDDRGPFVAGRTWDLDAAAKAGIGCSDLCRVRWRMVRR